MCNSLICIKPYIPVIKIGMNEINALYENCRLCPKNCGADRTSAPTGFCGSSGDIKIASAVLHKGEEPPLLGRSGSGTVFFSGCTLGCPFCQNIQLSCESAGQSGAFVGVDELTDIMLELEGRGAANINLVTATQFTPSVIEAASAARNDGLNIPITWNSSGWETVETVNNLSEVIDIWLPDLKTLDDELSASLFGAADYPEAASAALKAMASSVRAGGGFLMDDDLMKRGMIMRHLVIPGHVGASRDVLKWYSENLMDCSMLSLMVQYTPVNAAGREIAAPGYMISEYDYDMLLGWLEEFGIEEGFLQEPEAASSEWIPDFNRINPFPDKYSIPVWHWEKGFIQ